MSSFEIEQEIINQPVAPHRARGRVAAAALMMLSLSVADPGDTGPSLDVDQQEIVDGFDYLTSETRSGVISNYISQLARRVERSCEDNLPPACQEKTTRGIMTISTTYFGLYTIHMSGVADNNGALTNVDVFELSLSAQQNHNLADLPDGSPVYMYLFTGANGSVPHTRLLTTDVYNEGTDESNVTMVDVGGELGVNQGIEISRANIQAGDAVDGEFVPWAVVAPRSVDDVEELDRRAYMTARHVLDGAYLQAEEPDIPSELSIPSESSIPSEPSIPIEPSVSSEPIVTSEPSELASQTTLPDVIIRQLAD